jgi:hypothetical protein
MVRHTFKKGPDMSALHPARQARHRPAPPKGARGRKAGRPIHGEGEDLHYGFGNEEWHDMVSTAAYFRAEARGFENGSADEDWFEAEAELRERFGAVESDVERGPNPNGEPTDIEMKGE